MGQIHNLKLDEFASKFGGIGPEAFKAMFKLPFLLTETAPSKEPNQKVFRTVAPEEDTKQKPGSPLTDSDFEDQYVSTIEKSGRNAFKNMVTIGRSVNNDIIIASSSVSKLHAYFRYDAEIGMYSLTDVGSTNGTVYNKETLQPNVPAIVVSRRIIIFGGSVRATYFTPAHFIEYLALFKRITE